MAVSATKMKHVSKIVAYTAAAVMTLGCNHGTNPTSLQDTANQISLTSTSVITYDPNTASVTSVKLDQQRLAMLRGAEKRFRDTEQYELADGIERFVVNGDKASELKNLIRERNETSAVAEKLAKSCNADVPATIYQGLGMMDWALGFQDAKNKDKKLAESAQRSSCEKADIEKIW
jgi:hypothetical protein